jgi:hypothetical protein
LITAIARCVEGGGFKGGFLRASRIALGRLVLGIRSR